MPEAQESMEHLAEQVKAALESADLSAYSDLLDPHVQWGPPEDRSVCRNRRQVLTWYERGRESGTRAKVSEITVMGDRLLVGLRVSNLLADSAGAETDRWQVLTVRDGRVVQIVGYEKRDDAIAEAVMPLS